MLTTILEKEMVGVLFDYRSVLVEYIDRNEIFSDFLLNVEYTSGPMYEF